MNFIYILIKDGCEWEDMVVFLSMEDAIMISIKHPYDRVEIFSKTDTLGYTPTYNYYQNGKYIQTS